MFRSSLVFWSFVEDNPFLFAFGGLFISLIYFSILLFFSERLYYNYIDTNKLPNILNIWSFVLITISTIGNISIDIYGVISKFLIFLIVIWGAFYNAIFL